MWRFIFFQYGILSVSYTPYGKTNSARLSKLFVRVRSVFWQKCFFLEVSENSYRFCTLSIMFRAFGGNQVGLSIQHFTCGEQHSQGKYEKSAVNYFSRTYREKMSKKLWQNFQNCIFLVLRNTLRKFVSLKMYFFLSGILSVTFLPSGKQIQLASQNFILRVQKNNFLVKNPSKCTFFSFLVLTAKKSWRKHFWQNCQKCTWFVHCNNLREFTFLMIQFFLSGSLRVSFMLFGKTKWARLSK